MALWIWCINNSCNCNFINLLLPGRIYYFLTVYLLLAWHRNHNVCVYTSLWWDRNSTISIILYNQTSYFHVQTEMQSDRFSLIKWFLCSKQFVSSWWCTPKRIQEFKRKVAVEWIIPEKGKKLNKIKRKYQCPKLCSVCRSKVQLLRCTVQECTQWFNCTVILSVCFCEWL